MPVSPEMAARLTQDLRRVYEDAANQLIRSIAAQVGRGIQDVTWQDRKLDALTALMREADTIIVDLRRQVPGAVEQALAYAYRRGGATAAADAEAAGITGGFNHMPDSEAISRLLSEAMRPHEAVIQRIRRSVQDAYDDAVAKAAASMLTGSITRREAARQALTELARQGITGFTDRSGRNWDMAAYAEMATRTNTGHAAIQGHLDRLTGLGVDTVYCSDSPEECGTCRPFEHQVLSVSGATTGRLSDGREVLMSVADAQQAGLFHPNAILGEHSVKAIGGTTGAVRSWYEGPSVELTTASGIRLTVSPNHPVLTSRGWLAAERLRKGDQLFHAVDGGISPNASEVDYALDDVESGVADKFEALNAVGSNMRVPAASDHLHGDGKFCQGEIDVVVTHDRLLAVRDAQAVEKRGHLVLSGASVERHRGAGPGALHLGLHGVGGPVGRSLADGLAGRLEPSEKRLPADAEDVGQVLAGLPCAVAADELVDVNRDWFRGHAFDFQTGFGAYFLNTILVHNCTHSLSIYLPNFTELEPSQAPDPDDYAERQRQRAYERRIRSWRRRVEVEEAALGKDAPEAKAARKRLREVNAEYTAWLDAHNRWRSPGRTNLTVR